MANLELSGPYTLTSENIDLIVTQKSPGAYALGYTDNGGTFMIQYVGRSDNDVNNRLKSWAGVYKQFMVSYYNNPKEAFEKECTLYHDFGGVGNKEHPARPENSYWLCPVCRIFG